MLFREKFKKTVPSGDLKKINEKHHLETVFVAEKLAKASEKDLKLRLLTKTIPFLKQMWPFYRWRRSYMIEK